MFKSTIAKIKNLNYSSKICISNTRVCKNSVIIVFNCDRNLNYRSSMTPTARKHSLFPHYYHHRRHHHHNQHNNQHNKNASKIA